jgi:hypothetical protein
MNLLDLPPEIYLNIARHLAEDCDLSAFARTCRYLNPLLTHFLYSRLVRERDGPEVLNWASTEASAGTIVHLLDKGSPPDLHFRSRSKVY